MVFLVELNFIILSLGRTYYKRVIQNKVFEWKKVSEQLEKIIRKVLLTEIIFREFEKEFIVKEIESLSEMINNRRLKYNHF